MAETQRAFILPQRFRLWLLCGFLGLGIAAAALGQSESPLPTEPEATEMAPPAPAEVAPPAPEEGAEPAEAPDESDTASSEEALPPLPEDTAEAPMADGLPSVESPEAAAEGDESAVPDAAVADAEPAPDEGTAPATDPIADYLDAIDRLESSQGAYSPELADMYLGLGKAQLQARNFQEAKSAFQKGMQVQRVNEGLNSLSQEPYLLSLADLESALGDGKAANDAMADLYRIHASAYDARDERMLAVLDKMLAWYLKHAQYQAPKTGFLYLENAEKVARHMVVIHVETLRLADAGAADAFHKVGAVHYALVRHVQVHGLPDQEDRFNYEFGRSPAPVIQQPSVADIYFRRGENALEQAIAVLNQQEQIPALRKAQALAELGDWYTAFGKFSFARDYYRQAYGLLNEDAAQGATWQQSLFGQPRLIDFPAAMDEVPAGDGVEVMFDVTANGEPKNLQVGDLKDRIGAGQLKKLKRAVLKLRFRPQIQGGEQVRTEGFAYRYPLAVNEETHEKS